MKKYREYFMFFAGGFALAVSLMKEEFFLLNYIVLFMLPIAVVIIYMLYQSLKK